MLWTPARQRLATRTPCGGGCQPLRTRRRSPLPTPPLLAPLRPTRRQAPTRTRRAATDVVVDTCRDRAKTIAISAE